MTKHEAYEYWLMRYNKAKDYNLFVDCTPCEECTNPYTWGHICGKCGACGRKFDDKGVLIDNE